MKKTKCFYITNSIGYILLLINLWKRNHIFLSIGTALIVFSLIYYLIVCKTYYDSGNKKKYRQTLLESIIDIGLLFALFRW